MRNICQKSPFSKPTAANSFKKSDRIYPQTKQMQSKSRISIGKVQMVPEDQPNKVYRTEPILAGYISTYRYHFTTLGPYPIVDRNSNVQVNDATCLWFRNIQKSPNNKIRYLQIGRGQYVISNWSGEGYPNVIYICMDGIFGFFDINSLPTNRIAPLQLREINVVMDTSSLRTYQLRYVLQNNVRWIIPNELTHIKLSLKMEDNTSEIQLPLPNPITIALQIGQM